MTATAALTLFTIELGLACGKLGIPAPIVVPVHSTENYSYVLHTPAGFEPEVHVTYRLLESGDAKLVRCAARHEAAHLKLRHHVVIPVSKGVRKVWEREVDEITAKMWGEKKQCGMR